MAVHTNATAGAALGNELRAGTVAQVGSTKRIQALNGMLHANRPNVDHPGPGLHEDLQTD